MGDIVSETPEVPMKVEEALKYKMKREALQKCGDACRLYADCSRHRLLSVVWACRPQLNDLNACLSNHTTDAVLNDYKRAFLESKSEG
mmetsp:Transcript_34668/g.48058  ORF Transcript_34668/g.48058 Transcript_34668/m.48058 type:complete len:88 (+) Transcript_34668:122-385(+)